MGCQKAAVKVSTRARKRSISELTHGCWQDSVPPRPFESLSSSLGVGQKPPSIPCHRSLSLRQLSICQIAKSKQGAGAVCYSLVTLEEVISCPVCHILSIESC